MKVAVITPYFREPLEMLRACHQSVLEQQHPAQHFFIADGNARPELNDWQIQHIVLPKSHGDNGNTPRAIGSLSAMNQDFDAVAYLDADNRYQPDHLSRMAALHERTGAAVCVASRTIHRLDGSVLFEKGRPNDGTQHVDTSCLFLTRRAFRLLPIWAMMPQRMSPVCDQLMWTIIQSLGFSRAVEPQPTVAFRTQYAADYQAAGETPPPDAKTTEESFAAPIRWWASLPKDERLDWERRMGLHPH